MSSFSRRSLLGGFAIATSAGLLAVPAMAQLQAEIYVPTAPPPPRVEVVPVLPRERVEIEHWQPGYWRWNGGEYVWSKATTSAGRARAPSGHRAAGSSVRVAGSTSKATGTESFRLSASP